MNTTTKWFVAAIILLSCALVSRASDPTYDPRFSKRFNALTGYELSEDGVRAALDNFDELDYEGKKAAISVVGEQRYTSLTSYLKEIYARVPTPRPDPRSGETWDVTNDRRFVDQWKAYAVRALIRCGDPIAGQLALAQVSQIRSMDVSAGGYAIRNLKYLVNYDQIDVVKALTFVVDRFSDKDSLFARLAGRELADLEHYFRFSGDPRRIECANALDGFLRGERNWFHAEVESIRNGRPIWSEAYRFYSKHWPEPRPEDYPILDEAMDFIMGW